MIKLTPQQEIFAQCVSKGMTYSDAYREGYPKSKKWLDNSLWCKASLLMSDVKVMKRVDEIKNILVEDIKYDVEECFKEFEELRKDAMTDKDRNIQKACIENKGKLKGLFIDRTDLTSKNEAITMPTIQVNGKKQIIKMGD